jgi:hypothetical protein
MGNSNQGLSRLTHEVAGLAKRFDNPLEHIGLGPMIRDLAHISLLLFDAGGERGTADLMTLVMHVMVVNWAQTLGNFAALGIAKPRFVDGEPMRFKPCASDG